MPLPDFANVKPGTGMSWTPHSSSCKACTMPLTGKAGIAGLGDWFLCGDCLSDLFQYASSFCPLGVFPKIAVDEPRVEAWLRIVSA